MKIIKRVYVVILITLFVIYFISLIWVLVYILSGYNIDDFSEYIKRYYERNSL